MSSHIMDVVSNQLEGASFLVHENGPLIWMGRDSRAEGPTDGGLAEAGGAEEAKPTRPWTKGRSPGGENDRC